MQKILDWLKTERKTAVLVIAAALVSIVVLWYTNAPRSELVEPEQLDAAVTVVPAGIYVHVVGEVTSPGLYQLQPGQRIADAIELAGGFTSEASLESVNLARTPNDGDQIMVFSIHENKTDDGIISINTASETELERLPGVGPALAKRIVDYREKNGSFSTIEALDNVSGIGPAMLEKIRDLVRL